MYDFQLAAPRSTRSQLGMRSLRIGGGVALAMRHDPTGLWSKTLGIGFDEPVTDALIRDVGSFYRSERVESVTLQLAPSVLPANWDELRRKNHISAGPTWLKLTRDLTTPTGGTAPDRGTTLQVGPTTPRQADEWASVMLRAFGMPEGPLSQMAAASVGRTDWHAFSAWDNTEMVATATMHIDRDVAQFFAGATLPQARGRGAQSALLTARSTVALAAGCRWLVAETGAEAPGTHNPSLHNMLRSGFTIQYPRQDWIWYPRP